MKKRGSTSCFHRHRRRRRPIEDTTRLDTASTNLSQTVLPVSLLDTRSKHLKQIEMKSHRRLTLTTMDTMNIFKIIVEPPKKKTGPSRSRRGHQGGPTIYSVATACCTQKRNKQTVTNSTRRKRRRANGQARIL